MEDPLVVSVVQGIGRLGGQADDRADVLSGPDASPRVRTRPGEAPAETVLQQVEGQGFGPVFGAGLRRRELAIAKPPEGGDDLGQAGTLDECHRVERHVAVRSDGMDRNDVRVIQAGDRLRLHLEPPGRLGVEGRGRRQDLEGNAAAQGDLLRLIDDAHPAPTDLAADDEVAVSDR